MAVEPHLCRVGDNRDQMLALIDRMTPGDMPQFETAFQSRRRLEFSKLAGRGRQAHDRHQRRRPLAADQRRRIAALKALRVTVSTVAVAAHGPVEGQNLSNIAYADGRQVLHGQQSQGPAADLSARGPPRLPVAGLRAGLRPAAGGAAARTKFSAASTPCRPSPGSCSPAARTTRWWRPSWFLRSRRESSNDTILAAWPYGLGKAVAFTSDDGTRWTKHWPGEPAYDKLFGQMIRWAMRPAGGTEKFTTATEVADGQIRVVVNALDKNDEFLNFLGMTATVVGPDLKPVAMKMTQTAPGRYVGEMPAGDSGSYFIVVGPGGGLAPIRTGVTVPYSDEFRDLATNDALLGQLAGAGAQGGRRRAR